MLTMLYQSVQHSCMVLVLLSSDLFSELVVSHLWRLESRLSGLLRMDVDSCGFL